MSGIPDRWGKEHLMDGPVGSVIFRREGAIQWHPIGQMPDSLRDGRELLLWAGDVNMPEFGMHEGGIWVTREGATIRDVRAYVEINPPIV